MMSNRHPLSSALLCCLLKDPVALNPRFLLLCPPALPRKLRHMDMTHREPDTQLSAQPLHICTVLQALLPADSMLDMNRFEAEGKLRRKCMKNRKQADRVRTA